MKPMPLEQYVRESLDALERNKPTAINDATTVDDIEAMTLAEIRRLLIPAYQAVPSNVL